LIIQVQAPQFKCHVCVAHAPHSKVQGGEDQINRWWEKLGARLSKYEDTILLIDANGHLGTETSTSVGGLYHEQQDSCGQKFHKHLVDTGMYLPSTFSFDGTLIESKTYAGKHRNDYIAIPITDNYTAVKSYNWHRFDMLNKGIDHIPVCADVSITRNKPTNNGSTWRDMGIDKLLLADPKAVHYFKDRIRAIQLPKADVHVDTHADYNTFHVHSAMKDAFAVLPGRKARPHLSDHTWHLIEFRRAIHTIANDSVVALDKRFQITVLRAWHRIAKFIPSDVPITMPIIDSPDDFLKHIRIQITAANLILDRTLPIAKASLKFDKTTYVTSIGQQINMAPSHCRHDVAWKLIKPLQVTKKSAVLRMPKTCRATN